MNRIFVTIIALLLAPVAALHAATEKPRRAQTPAPTHPPLQAADITKLPDGVERLDLFLLMGQSNMRGRGKLPAEQKRNPRIVMMHIKNDQWYLAQESLHFAGDPVTMTGDDNSGVGPGLSFAESLVAKDAKVRIGVIPCAVGGSKINRWQKGANLYDEALRRAKLAMQTAAPVKGRIRGVLWLQGESDANPNGLAVHETKLLKLVDDLRADLAIPDLPFIACTIGNFPRKSADEEKQRSEINKILLDLPTQRPYTACVDARDLKDGHRGDNMHYKSEAQVIIGQRYAEQFIQLAGQKAK